MYIQSCTLDMISWLFADNCKSNRMNLEELLSGLVWFGLDLAKHEIQLLNAGFLVEWSLRWDELNRIYFISFKYHRSEWSGVGWVCVGVQNADRHLVVTGRII